MLMLALRLFLKDKGGGKQHCLIPFVGLPFNCFLVIKGILKVLFSFIPWLLNFSDLPMAQIWGKDIH